MVPYDLITEEAAIGDGPQGSGGTSTGDFDFFSITVPDSEFVGVTVTRTDTTFRPIVAIYGNDGTLFAVFDDLGSTGVVPIFLELISVGGPTNFYIAVGGNLNLDGNASDELLTDPFDDTTGPGAGSEGTYSLEIQFLPPGDFDFFSFDALNGDFITLDVDTDAYLGVLDPILGLFDSAGNLMAFNDDGPSQGSEPYDSYLSVLVPADGTYYAVIGGFSSFDVPASLPGDLDDSSSGPGFGSEGDYDFIMNRNTLDLDVFSFDLVPGDIIGMNLSGLGEFVYLLDSVGAILNGSFYDSAGIYPPASPLPGGGNSSNAYIVNDPGTYYALVLGGQGAYTLGLRAFRPPQESTRTTQRIFLDFDGETLDTSVFGGFPGATLSPLSSFLADWGLQPTDEDAVIDAIVAETRRSLETDIRAQGLSSMFDIEILNSRDHADPFAGGAGTYTPVNTTENTSRIIVGGTVAESGVNTIGIAQSIDIGNFDMSETALVLLDLLSDPNTANPNSLNQYALDVGASKIDLVAAGVGNITAHEAGHFLANFHTDNSNPSANIMDTGGNLDNIVGVGPDRIFGTADDVAVTFGADSYDPFEGFVGTEDTRNAVGWALPGGAAELACSSGAPPVVCSLGDVDGDGDADMAAVLPGASVTAQVRDATSGALISTVDLGTDAGVAVEVVSDINGNGAPELALLANRPTGQIRVLVRDSLTGDLLNTIFYGATYVALDMAVLPDTDSNNFAELAVLGRSLAGGIRVQARDSSTDAETSTTFYGSNADPVDVQVLPDISGNGVPEIIVHARVTATNQVRAQIRDANTGAMFTQVFFGSAYTPLQLALIGDVSGDGIPDLAQLGIRSDTGAVRVQVKASSGGPVISNAFLGNTELPVEVTGIGDANGDASPDFAVLVERTNGSGKVILRDATTGDFIRNTFVGKVLQPDGLIIIDDVDVSGDPEVAALGDSSDSPGTPRAQVKDSIEGTAINTIDFP